MSLLKLFRNFERELMESNAAIESITLTGKDFERLISELRPMMRHEVNPPLPTDQLNLMSLIIKKGRT
jgi:hypothetical protein